MANFQYKAGLHNVGSYQVSGKPFATGSINCKDNAEPIAQINFPSVTSWVVVTNSDNSNDLRVGFSANGVGPGSTDNSFLAVSPNTTTTRLELKLSQLFLSGSTDCSVMAGLTFIGLDSVNNSAISPDGANWSGSAGV